jgi:predicted GNAT superfamily acetyltransferase
MKNLKKIHAVKGKRFLFEVETSEDYRDYMKYEELRHEIWADPKDTLPGARNMWCENFIHEGSSLFIAVYAEDEKGRFGKTKENLVGFSYGFVGLKNKEIAFRRPANLQFYSQYTGVRQDFEHYGLGILIKEFQKEILIKVFGIYTVTNTFDPLTGVNAYRNIHIFGMEVVDYREALYGDFGGLLNRTDIPCDRFFVCWDLRKKIQRPDYDLESLIESEQMMVEAALRKVRGRKGVVSLEVIKKTNLALKDEFLLVEIPYDFYYMLQETDVAEAEVRRIPLEWRMKTREAFKSLFKKKYTIIDFRQVEEGKRRRDFYVLMRKKTGR